MKSHFENSLHFPGHISHTWHHILLLIACFVYKKGWIVCSWDSIFSIFLRFQWEKLFHSTKEHIVNICFYEKLDLYYKDLEGFNEIFVLTLTHFSLFLSLTHLLELSLTHLLFLTLTHLLSLSLTPFVIPFSYSFLDSFVNPFSYSLVRLNCYSLSFISLTHLVDLIVIPFSYSFDNLHFLLQKKKNKRERRGRLKIVVNFC